MTSIQMLKNYFGKDENEFIFKEAEKMYNQEIIDASGYAISKYLYKQAVQESEKNKIAEDKKIQIVSTNVKGEIIKVGENLMVSHNLIDPFGQIPLALPIHINSYIVTQLTENQNVYFDIVFEKNEYFALI
jgi:uncharacterized protein YqgQ